MILTVRIADGNDNEAEDCDRGHSEELSPVLVSLRH